MSQADIEKLEAELAKLLIEKEKAKKKLTQVQQKNKIEERKARNHKIFKLGGLVAWALSEDVDVEFLTGCLMGMAKIKKDSDKYLLYKNQGAFILDKYGKKKKE